eukprot:1154793-Pelagomonas_calceolata.AAC.2
MGAIDTGIIHALSTAFANNALPGCLANALDRTHHFPTLVEYGRKEKLCKQGKTSLHRFNKRKDTLAQKSHRAPTPQS